MSKEVQNRHFQIRYLKQFRRKSPGWILRIKLSCCSTLQEKWTRPVWEIGWSLRWMRRCMENLFSDERTCFHVLRCCVVKGVEMSCKFFKRDRLHLWWFSLCWSMSNSISFPEDTNRTILRFSRDHKIIYVECVAQNHQKIQDFRGSQQFFAESSRPHMCNPRPAAWFGVPSLFLFMILKWYFKWIVFFNFFRATHFTVIHEQRNVTISDTWEP